MTAQLPTNESGSLSSDASEPATAHVLLHHPWGVAWFPCPASELHGILPYASSWNNAWGAASPTGHTVHPDHPPSSSGAFQVDEDDTDDASVATDAAVASPGLRLLPLRSEEAGGAVCDDPARLDPHYRDWSCVPREAVDASLYASRRYAFPVVMMRILSCGEHGDSIIWLPHGRAFAIVDRARFCAQVTSRFFRTSEYEKFMEWIDAFAFRQITDQAEAGAIVFYHEKFLRDQPWLTYNMEPQNRAS